MGFFKHFSRSAATRIRISKIIKRGIETKSFVWKKACKGDGSGGGANFFKIWFGFNLSLFKCFAIFFYIKFIKMCRFLPAVNIFSLVISL